MNTDKTPLQKPSIHRILELQKLLVTFAGINRKVYMPPRAEVAESDLEHSFSLTMLAWFLAPHFPQLNSGKLIELCLAHDMLEVYCGDTFSFDEQAVSGQKELEARAIACLKEEWADFPALTEAIDEYEECITSEAHFIRALDRIHPVLMDYLCEGKTWHKLGITFEKFLKVKGEELAASPDLAEYYFQLKEILVKNPQLFP